MNKIKKGDNVKILAGKDSGQTGTIDRVLVKTGKVVISGKNIYKRSVKRSGSQEGGIIELAKPMNISNVSLVCPNCKKITRVGFKIEGKEKIRICRKCGKEIK